MKSAKVNAYIMHTLCIHHAYIWKDRAFIYTCILKCISKCITLMTSKWQSHTYISDAHLKKGRNMTFMDLVSDRTLVTLA